MSKDNHAADRAANSTTKAQFLLLVPICAFTGLVLVLAWGLTRDPKILPSALIDKPVPVFDLPPVKGRDLGLSNKDLSGAVSVVNVFASWCVPCRTEHPIIKHLSETGAVPVHGLNYKDKPDDAASWLNELGDPYMRTGADLDGRVGIEWGVYGVPETYVIGMDGRIAYKHVGPVTQKILAESILPLIKKLQP